MQQLSVTNSNLLLKESKKSMQNYWILNYYTKAVIKIPMSVKGNNQRCLLRPVKLGDNTFVIEWFAGINCIILLSQI